MSLGIQMAIAAILGMIGVIGRYFHPGPFFEGAMVGAVIVLVLGVIRLLISAVSSR